MKFFNFSHARGDIFGGITAGVVALPLALAFGEASGAGPIAGLWGAILVGFFAAMFGGTGTLVSGPTAPMVVVFAGAFASLSGNLSLVFAAVVLAGLIQIAFGLLKFGQYIRLVPYPVISGFMSGIGVIIIVLQISRLFGHEPESGGTLPALLSIPDAISAPQTQALILGLITLALSFLWPKRLNKIVPGALLALIVGTLIGTFFVKGAPVLGDIPIGLPNFSLPIFTQDTLWLVVKAAFILAILGCIDSLLTSLIADNVTRTRHDSDKELIGQGVGNTLAGLFGALPGAGATMCTMVNIRSGGKTKLSGMTHALLLLGVVLILSPLASNIPHAVLAGILIKVGYDIIDLEYLKQSHRGPKWDLTLMTLVLLLTVFVDLITAVAIGVVLASLSFVKRLADLQLKNIEKDTSNKMSEQEQQIIDQSHNKIVVFNFDGPLSFGAAADLSSLVQQQAHDNIIVLNFSHMPFMDVSAARAIEAIACDCRRAERPIFMAGANEKVQSTLDALNAEHCIPDNNKYNTRLEAMQAALDFLNKKVIVKPSTF